ncbi:MAG TPA: VIT1/CCC1 transporter family protein [Chitinophaga sp.]
MAIRKYAVRSTGWKTDFLVGFPDGLFLLYFTTQTLALHMNVQRFYDIHLWIWLGFSVLVGVSSFFTNWGADDQHDDTMTDAEKKKLQRLELSEQMIGHIQQGMADDAEKWKTTLENEKVQQVPFVTAAALRSAIATAFSFLLGGYLPLWPYLASENFNDAGRQSTYILLAAVVVFAFLKARLTQQKTVPVLLRTLLTATGIVLGSWLLAYWLPF